MIISIDVGRNQVKAVCGDQELSFKSAVGEWRRRKVGKAGDYEIERKAYMRIINSKLSSYKPSELLENSPND